MSSIDFKEFLLRDEKVIWSGRPVQGLLFTGKDVFLIPFSLLWGGFALFWESTVLSQANAPVFMKFWGIPFVLIGLYLIVGRFLIDAWIRTGLRYAITNKRVLISRAAPFSKFTALSLDRLQEADLTQRADGRGTIRFGQAVSMWQRSNSFGSWTPALDPTPQFILIEDVRSVYQQLERAMHDGK
jgi:hypothetical protein